MGLMGKFVLVFTDHQKKTFQKLAGAYHGHTSKITANAFWKPKVH